MNNRRLLLILLVTSCSLFVTDCFAEESFTITTYYPSPYGSYRELRAQRMAIGPTYYNAGTYPWDEGGVCAGNEICNADLVVEGNVGIGTRTPITIPGGYPVGNVGGNLTVRGRIFIIDDEKNTWPAERLNLLHKRTTGRLVTGDEFGTVEFFGNEISIQGRGAYIVGSADANTTLTTTPGRLSFYVQNTSGAMIPAMTIKNDGNVGIGTANPSAKLDVENPSGTSLGIVSRVRNLNNQPGNNGLLVNIARTSPNTDAYALNVQSGGASRLYVRSDGNVGIGVTDPGNRKLYVNGPVTIGESLYLTRGASATWMNIGPNGNLNIGQSPNDATIAIEANLPINDDTRKFAIYNPNRPGPSKEIFAVSASGRGYWHGDVTMGEDLQVIGNLSKGGGGFLIDHPLDPQNKILRHSLVESPDMKNIYDGMVVLDKNGEAVVELPKYFEALNKDYRYQLTPVGTWAPLYIKEEIRDNRFVIAGGLPGLKVSWQVTGIRQDAYAKKKPIIVEEEKGKGNNFKKGEYLYPDAFMKRQGDSEEIRNK